MRATAVKTAVIDSVEAISPDSNVGGEVFRYVDLGGREPSALTERAFTLDLSSMSRAEFITLDCQVVTYGLTVYFHSYEGAENRISDDTERIIAALNPLHEQDGDIYAIEFGPAEITPSADLDGMLEAEFDLEITYRRTGV